MIVLMYLQKNQMMRIKITCRDLLSALNQTALQKQRDFVLFGQEVFPRINIYIALVVLLYNVVSLELHVCLNQSIYNFIGDEIKQKKLCQLRRFQDGTIKETVNIKVSSGGGHANDFVLDKIVHLISVNFAKIEVKICRGKKPP